MHLVEQRSDGTWQFKPQWERSIVAPRLMTRMQAVFEELEFDATLYNNLYNAVIGDPEGRLLVCTLALPIVPLPDEAILGIITDPLLSTSTLMSTSKGVRNAF